MTYTELQTRAALLAAYEGWADTPTAPDWAALINQAYEDFAYETEAFTDEVTVNTAAGTASYTLLASGKSVKSVKGVWYDTASLKLPLEEISERALFDIDPRWRYGTSGVPSYYFVQNFDTIWLHPAPNAIKVVLVRGIVDPTALSQGSDVPGFPSFFHEALVLRAVWIHAKIYATGPGRERLGDFLSEYNAYVDRFRKGIHPKRVRRATRWVSHSAAPRIPLR